MNYEKAHWQQNETFRSGIKPLRSCSYMYSWEKEKNLDTADN